jgi:hypothetical protein
MHINKKGKKTPLVCTAVRRSSRIKALNKGYKAKTCFDKNCLACAAARQIKKSVVTNLYGRFNIPKDVKEATEEEQSLDEHDTYSCTSWQQESKDYKKGPQFSYKEEPQE